MMIRKVLLVMLFVIFIISANGQTNLPVPASIKKANQNGTRSMNGLPGANYWQNKADYDIKVNFNPATRVLIGTVNISYLNNSSDTLKRVLFKLFPNLYQKQAMRTIQVNASDLTEGVSIKSIIFNGVITDSTKRSVRGTNMNVSGLKILPHNKADFEVSYSYTLNKSSFNRTGQIEPGAFFIAYFFPRITVYDDIDGWNEYPYTGQYEFYNDYGNFKAEITVPADYQVWATGDLKNINDIYQPKFAKLIRRAEQYDSLTDIITEQDLKSGGITNGKETNTWHFEADNVTDMAFGVSNYYVWKASSLVVDAHSGRRTRVDAIFNPLHKSYMPVIGYARKTTELISYKFPGIPFPYSHITIFDGLDAMEYPMMVNDLPFEKQEDAIEFTAHEIFHSLFPFYVGTNETKYSFMDEGWATLAEFTLHPFIDSTTVVGNNISDVNKSAGTELDVPVMTLTPQLLGAARYADKDMKPALGYLYVKELLGNTLFTKALNYYITQWKGRHPTPYDFFNCMNTGAGTNLNWFWYNWFFTKEVPDLAITNVSKNKFQYYVTVQRIGEAMVPVHLTIFYSDGTRGRVERTIACWKANLRSLTLKFSSVKAVSKIVLGDDFDADSDKSNNEWYAKQ